MSDIEGIMKRILSGFFVVLLVLLSANGTMTIFAKSKRNDGVPIGTISAWAGKANLTPTGWRICNGDSLRRRSYPKLFKVIGTVWGAENEGSFNLPDLSGRFLRGVDFGTQRDPDASKRKPCNPGGNSKGVGTVQEDAIQEHTHYQQPHSHNHGAFHGHYTFVLAAVQAGTQKLPIGEQSEDIPETEAVLLGAKSFGKGGKIRDSAESRPKNAAVVYIIKVN